MGAGACQITGGDPDLANGKAAFVERCGSCHVLDRANTTGVSGPDLDAAFQRALADGMKRSTIEGVVHAQIDNPNINEQKDPKTGEPAGYMPPDLVTGRTARDVAAYVAYAAARGGEDSGRLADIGAAEAEGTAEAENGTLSIPADPSGALAYVFADAVAPPGPLTIESENESPVPHNIAVDGEEVGEVVQNGGVSTIEVDLQPGEYTFYCSVPGHREGGMEGTLTIE